MRTTAAVQENSDEVSRAPMRAFDHEVGIHCPDLSNLNQGGSHPLFHVKSRIKRQIDSGVLTWGIHPVIDARR